MANIDLGIKNLMGKKDIAKVENEMKRKIQFVTRHGFSVKITTITDFIDFLKEVGGIVH